MSWITEATHLRVGYVPEHFAAPLHFALANGHFAAHALTVDLIPFPSGTGHMVASLASSSLDVAIGLTEGWVAALGRGDENFKIVGKYVDTPLCWAISTAGDENKGIASVDELSGKEGKKGKLGVSRIGSGSYVMGHVLAEEKGWLRDDIGEEPFEFAVLNTFEKLREAVNAETVDAFMWEYFTSKKYYDTHSIRHLGNISTPWPSWHIVAHTSLLNSPTTLKSFLNSLNQGIYFFNTSAGAAAAVKWISTALDYSKEDAEKWMETVGFARDTKVVVDEEIENTVRILRKAGVIKNGSVGREGMVWDGLVR